MTSYVLPKSISGKAFTILGAGTLGRRIALMWLTQGETVNLFDTKQSALDDARAYIESTLPEVIETQVRDGKPGILHTFTDRSKALENSWVVTEAVPEIQDLKVKLLGELDSILPSDVILATNSSSYTPTETGSLVKSNRLIATHYYMPPKSLPVEIMPRAGANPEIAPLYYREALRHGLQPYNVRKESVGLIANRIWAAIKRESLFVAAEGVAEPREIDALLKNAFGMAGPFANMDQVGLDVVLDIENHYSKVRPGQCPPEVRDYLKSFVDSGRLGTKSGHGFYPHPKTVPHAVDHLLYLDIVRGEVKSITTDGKQDKVLVSGLGSLPDGIQLDSEKGLIYWTTMGYPATANNGAVWSATLTGENVQTIVPAGKTHTPKQLQFEPKSQTLYWCDREGGRIQRVKTDGSGLETLYDTAPGEARPLTDQTKWAVGIALDVERGLIYWTQKGGSKGFIGRLFRANIDIPAGETAENRSDIQTLYTGLPEPIDWELDAKTQTLYWTDRGDPGFGNTLNRASVASKHDPKAAPVEGASKGLVIAEHFHETIGLTRDDETGTIYVSDLLGSIYAVEGSDEKGWKKRTIVQDAGNYTGIALQKGK